MKRIIFNTILGAMVLMACGNGASHTEPVVISFSDKVAKLAAALPIPKNGIDAFATGLFTAADSVKVVVDGDMKKFDTKDALFIFNTAADSIAYVNILPSGALTADELGAKLHVSFTEDKDDAGLVESPVPRLKASYTDSLHREKQIRLDVQGTAIRKIYIRTGGEIPGI